MSFRAELCYSSTHWSKAFVIKSWAWKSYWALWLNEMRGCKGHICYYRGRKCFYFHFWWLQRVFDQNLIWTRWLIDSFWTEPFFFGLRDRLASALAYSMVIEKTMTCSFDWNSLAGSSSSIDFAHSLLHISSWLLFSYRVRIFHIASFWTFLTSFAHLQPILLPFSSKAWCWMKLYFLYKTILICLCSMHLFVSLARLYWLFPSISLDSGTWSSACWRWLATCSIWWRSLFVVSISVGMIR